MITQIFTFVFLLTVVHGGLIGLEGGLGFSALGGGIGSTYGGGIGLAGGATSANTASVIDYYAPPKYEFKYAVADPKTGDKKEQSEVREGDVVKGEYSLAEPDGTIRVVKYSADKANGFNAIVERIGKAAHPQVLVQKAVAVPVLTKGFALGGGEIGFGGIGLSAGGNGYGGGVGGLGKF